MEKTVKLFKQVEVTAKRYFFALPGEDNSNEAYLTQQEVRIVSLMITGKRPKQIAWELNNSPHTINSHIANIKEKLQCTNNFQLGYILGGFNTEMEEQLSY